MPRRRLRKNQAPEKRFFIMTLMLIIAATLWAIIWHGFIAPQQANIGVPASTARE